LLYGYIRLILAATEENRCSSFSLEKVVAMGQDKDIIVAMSGTGDNDAINFIMHNITKYFADKFDVEYFDIGNFGNKEGARFFNVMSSGKVKFGMTWCGIGQDLKVALKNGDETNIWEHFNVPLLKFQGDTPAYFLERHMDIPSNAVLLYGWEEHLAVHDLIFPNSQCVAAISPALIFYDTLESNIDFRSRKNGKLYFLKNGKYPHLLTRYWEEGVPHELGKHLKNLASELLSIALEPGRVQINDVVVNYFLDQKIKINNINLICFFVAQMDDFLRRIKGTMVAQALLPFPVMILGEGWGYLDTAGAKAIVAPSQHPSLTEDLYRSQLGIIDMSPNVDTAGHDRMARAAGTYSFALANQTTWLNKLSPALNDAGYRFDFENIQYAVNEALRKPDDCIELGRLYGRSFREQNLPDAFVDRICELAELAKVRHAMPPGCHPL
jgi:hypothetical protein